MVIDTLSAPKTRPDSWGLEFPNLEALECAENRATLIGFGELSSEQAYEYRVPLPECLERVTDPRSLTVTLAWFTPVRPGYLN